MRLFLLTLCLLLGAGCVVPPATPHSQEIPPSENSEPTRTQDPSPGATEDTMSMPVTIHQLNLNPANTYLIEAPEGLILVDTSMGFYANRILAEIEGLDKGPLCLIYVTHAHIDHYAGASAIREATGAPIAIHELDAEAMERGDTRLGTVRNWNWTGSVMPWVEKAIRSAPTVPDILLQDGDRIDQCGLDGEVVWTPGHTPGSSSLLVSQSGAKHIFVGDLISSAGSLHIQSTYAGDWALIVPSVEKALSYSPDDFYPGHGPAPVASADVEALVR